MSLVVRPTLNMHLPHGTHILTVMSTVLNKSRKTQPALSVTIIKPLQVSTSKLGNSLGWNTLEQSTVNRGVFLSNQCFLKFHSE